MEHAAGLFKMEVSVLSSVKESLHNTIELLTDEEAHQILEFIQNMQRRNGASPTLRRLVSDPAFEVPLEGPGTFRVVVPIQGQGVAASRLLVEERR